MTVGGHLVAADVLRVGRRHVHRDFLHELLEALGAGHEVGLAVHFHEHADLAAHVDVAADHALRRVPAGALGGLGQAALAQHRDRLVHVAAALGEGGLAFHHARAGLLPEGLHLFCCDRHDSLVLRCTQIAPARGVPGRRGIPLARARRVPGATVRPTRAGQPAAPPGAARRRGASARPGGRPARRRLRRGPTHASSGPRRSRPRCAT